MEKLESIKKIISTGNSRKAIDEIIGFMEEYSFPSRKSLRDFYDEAIILNGKLNSLTKKIRIGIISSENEILEKSKIDYSLLEIINNIPDSITFKQEIGKQLSEEESKEIENLQHEVTAPIRFEERQAPRVHQEQYSPTSEDIDKVIVNFLVETFQQKEKFDIRKDDPHALQRLEEAAKQARFELFFSTETEINLPYITATDAGPIHLVIKLSRDILTNQEQHSLTRQDVDKVIVNFLADSFKQKEKVDLRKDPHALQRLEDAAEQAKLELSSSTETEINLPYITAIDGVPKHLVIKLKLPKTL